MNFEGFILIGGKSSRMGEDKFALKLNNKTFLQITAETLEKSETTQTSIVVSKQTQFDFEFPVIKDIYQNRGALSGIHSALVNTKSDHIIILACDYPFVSIELIDYLINVAKLNPQFEAIVPIQPDGKVQPLCAVYKIDPCRKILSEMLENESEKYSVRDFLATLKTNYIEFSEISHLPNSEIFFFNVNKPEDFEKAKMIVENSKVEIAKMTVSDLEAVMKIQDESNLSYWSYTSYKDEIDLENSFTIAAKIDEHTVGFLVGRLIIAENCGELYNIGVDLEFRRRKIGDKLMQNFIKGCVDKGLEKLFLEVRESNETAIHFYKRYDFKAISKRRNFYTNPQEDAILMVKNL